MSKKDEDKSIRVKKSTQDELRKFKDLYELQDNKSYSFEDAILLLMRDRGGKQFILPVTKDKKEATSVSSQPSQ
jgi:predicted nucleic acid-binding protein